jgi:hypothetical protein
MTTPDTAEPWSSYRKLNNGLESLVANLGRTPTLGKSLTRELDRQLAEARHQARELAAQAKTVETAAMVRVLTFVRSTIVATAQTNVAQGDDPLVVMDTLVRQLNETIDDCARS